MAAMLARSQCVKIPMCDMEIYEISGFSAAPEDFNKISYKIFSQLSQFKSGFKSACKQKMFWNHEKSVYLKNKYTQWVKKKSNIKMPSDPCIGNSTVETRRALFEWSYLRSGSSCKDGTLSFYWNQRPPVQLWCMCKFTGKSDHTETLVDYMCVPIPMVASWRNE